MADCRNIVTYDRITAARLGLTAQSLDAALYSAFGQSEVSMIYTDFNQYYVVLGGQRRSSGNRPEGLNSIYFNSLGSSTSAGPMPCPARYRLNHQAGTTPLEVNHTGLFPSVTVSFNLGARLSLSDATAAFNRCEARLGIPHHPRLLRRHAAGLSGIS